MVQDAAGRAIGSTYLRRAKGLLKSGRAVLVDDHTIQLRASAQNAAAPEDKKEQNMEKGVITTLIKKILLKIAYWVVSLLIFFNAMIILDLHLVVPFFPVLFLFDFCFWVGYPLFMEYVLKRKWFECTKEDYLALKYILTPWLIMEVIVMIYYYNEIILLSQFENVL